MINVEPFISATVGKAISHAWNGYGLAIFIEFGELTQTARLDGTSANPSGELTLMVEWSWRLEKRHSILGGSWSSQKRWPYLLKKIQGATVTEVEIFGTIPEIAVSLSNGLRIVSFMTAESQPSWTLLTNNPHFGHLCVKRGRLKVETALSI